MLVTQKRLLYELPAIRTEMNNGRYCIIVNNLIDRRVLAYFISKRISAQTQLDMPPVRMSSEDYILIRFYNDKRCPEYGHYISQVFPIVLAMKRIATDNLSQRNFRHIAHWIARGNMSAGGFRPRFYHDAFYLPIILLNPEYGFFGFCLIPQEPHIITYKR